jgi:glutaredoxin
MVTIISSQTCPWCAKVKELLNMHNISYDEWIPEDNFTLGNILAQYNVKTVPQVFTGGDPRKPDDKEGLYRIGGYEATQAWINDQYQ